MTSPPAMLPSPVWSRVLAAWQDLSGDPSAFDEPGVRWRVSPNAVAGRWVTLTRLGAATLVSLPDDAARPAADHDGPLEPAAALELWPDAEEVLGPAVLWFADPDAVPFPADPPEVLSPNDTEIARLLVACPASDVAEAAAEDMAAFAVVREDGEVVATCGWRPLAEDLAFPGPLTRPDRRRLGLGTAAARAATWRAAQDGLVPMWRAPLGNEASARIAERIGYVEAGQQLALRLPERG